MISNQEQIMGIQFEVGAACRAARESRAQAGRTQVTEAARSAPSFTPLLKE